MYLNNNNKKTFKVYANCINIFQMKLIRCFFLQINTFLKHTVENEISGEFIQRFVSVFNQITDKQVNRKSFKRKPNLSLSILQLVFCVGKLLIYITRVHNSTFSPVKMFK
jgi:hypothetical protein